MFLRSQEHSKDIDAYRDPNLGKITVAELWEHYIQTSPPEAASNECLSAAAKLSLSSGPLSIISVKSGFFSRNLIGANSITLWPEEGLLGSLR